MGPLLAQLAAEARGLNTSPRLDRDRVFHLKQQALRAIWDRGAGGEGGESLPSPSGRGAGGEGGEVYPRLLGEGQGVRAISSPPFAAQHGVALERFATFCGLAEQFGPDWRKWPDEYRRPENAAVARFAADHAAAVDYHAWLQWLLDRQLAEASRAIPIFQDLPIGMDPGGADAWEWQDLLAKEMVIGAPPDAFNAEGQDWQLPPFTPARLRAAAYEPFVQTIRAVLRYAGGLRMDHVMGLFRLWWIPSGRHPRQGWYVRYPADDLLGIVALESHRAGAVIVGEDLGTVEPGVRQRLALRRMLSYRLLWFEPGPPAEYPELSMASVTTHDLPTIAGLWSGADEAEQRSIGLTVGNGAPAPRSLAADARPGKRAPVEEVIEAAYRRLGQASSRIVTATLEDAQAMRQRPNMPGTTDQAPTGRGPCRRRSRRWSRPSCRGGLPRRWEGGSNRRRNRVSLQMHRVCHGHRRGEGHATANDEKSTAVSHSFPGRIMRNGSRALRRQAGPRRGVGDERGKQVLSRNERTHLTLKRITRKLGELGIDYVVVGGMAMFQHGYRRFTEDVDLLVTREGLKEIHQKLEGLGYRRPFQGGRIFATRNTASRSISS